ncbi:biotin--[acetyl-CoA-carboxylase] ligase [Weeksellaceae bacterium KMM 9713]|uniref:Biotin--[acetyl-CoA-carboxylase] ligase n=1 Tax=Profundicola chukchiensis TaxID=2961959 RepID=A0A9X4MZK3_9FLAO|nr:biotin--[acetyl-CoA-carboxylase] ligase [Profundicola chukchiensis]MDG4946540.1 biotin--[acetyl-CoA-carboxylase] ligase [Profundicola chukchiensis]
MLKKLNFLHFESLGSTNQKLYQLTENNVPSWTVVSADKQSSGKGYANNVWLSEDYKNATFSFLLRYPFQVQEELAIFNMWISTEITRFLSNWQIVAQVKWPNDIILNNKKIAGILIETKLTGDKTKFCVIGLGININQVDFGELEHVSSLKLENKVLNFDIQEFIKSLMLHFYDNFYKMETKQFDLIYDTYNNQLFKKGKVSVFEINSQKMNGIIQYVNREGNLVVDLEDRGEKSFRHKEIKLLY